MDDGVGDEASDVCGGCIPLKERECVPYKLEGCNMLESEEMIIHGEGDYPESSPQVFANVIDGKNLGRSGKSLAGSEHYPRASPRSLDEAAIMVEELTLQNYSGANTAVVGPSNNRDTMHPIQNHWHLYQLAGGSGSGSSLGDALYRNNGPATLDAWEDVGHSSFSEFLAEKQTTHDGTEIKEQKMNSEDKGYLDNSLSLGGIRTKIISKSGFSDFFVKNTLKGKGVICRYPARDGAGIEFRGQNNSTPTSVTQTTADALQSSSPKTDVPSPIGIDCDGADFEFRGHNTMPTNVTQTAADALQSSSPKTAVPSLNGIAKSEPGPGPDSAIGGVRLREWLKAGLCKVKKIERLYIFRQILNFVDSYHSQGVVLQDLRPSCFTLSPSNRATYIGPSAQHELRGNIDQDNLILENKQRGKRPLKLGVSPSISYAKKHKFSQNPKFSRWWPQFPLKSSFDYETPNATGIGISAPQDSGNDFNNPKMEHNTPSKISSTPVYISSQMRLNSVSNQLEEKWYTSPEELGEGRCTFSANIYSLGVLLFELLGSFDSEKAHAAAMLDLRHRILPPNFLSENPKEAGFCLWLLHPKPSSRPKTREILQSEFINGSQKLCGEELSSSIEQEDVEAELLLHFLVSMKEKNDKHALNLGEDIRCLEADIKEVGRRHSSNSSNLTCSLNDSFDARENRILHKVPFSSEVLSQSSPISYTNELRLIRNIGQLESAYFSMRSKIQLPETDAMTRSDKDLLKIRENLYPPQNDEEVKSTDCLGAFFNGLCKYARYSKFEVRGVLRNGEFMNSSNVICSLSFDRDGDYFATAGVSKKIKIFEFEALLNDSVDIHYPVIEMPNRSKLSCVCWNNYIKNYMASTDYNGVVKLWDANTGQAFSHYIEHQKRAWSVDFSHVDPTKLASGSDDCSVKLWSINEKNCLGTIRKIANVCCVQFSAHSANLLAFGSADYKIYCYDLRNTISPWCTLAGHEKAVSYVKFVDSETLVSASTDNTIKLWDLSKTSSNGLSTNACSLTLSGHCNEKNFVGLSVADGYIACGSETNEVYAYHKSLPMPITSHKFGSIDPISGKEANDDNGHFVSSVCWRGKSDMVIAANSTGCIKVLQMV